MALVTNELLNKLSSGIKKTFRNAFDRAEPEYKRVATIVPSKTASNTYDWLGNFPKMREWVGARVTQNVKTNGYFIPNKTYESTIGVKRTDVEDDNLGHLTGMVEDFADESAVYPNEHVFEALQKGDTRLCYDGQNFFDAEHPVYENHDGTGAVTPVSNFDNSGGDNPYWYLLYTKKSLKPIIFQKRTDVELTSQTDLDSPKAFTYDEYEWGTRARSGTGYGLWQMAYKSNKPLTMENLNEAYAKMHKLKGDGGKKLNFKPDLLVVSPNLRAKAEELVTADKINGTSNINKGLLDVMATAYID